MSTQAPEIIEAPPARQPKPKKKVVRRAAPDRSQAIRKAAQWTFVALNAWIGLQFYLWVRWFERGGVGWHVSRPAGVEGWLPIAGLMNLKYFAVTGRIPPVHPAAMFLLVAFLLISILMKKAFCSWLCPVGTFSEYLWRIGRLVFRRNFRLPRWLDIPLRGLKYLLLGFFVYVIAAMSAEELAGFMLTPYGLITDVKMLDFFRTLSLTGVAVLLILGGLSMLVQNFWCRYLCPYGALMGLVSLVSPVKIRRDPEACIDCGRCAKACSAGLKVDQLVQIRSVECSACLECVASCPVEHGLQFAAPPRRADTPADRWRGRATRPEAVAAMLAVLFLGAVLVAHATGHWQMHLPERMYRQLVPNANQVTHPGM